ncbi:MAG: transcriptional repressor [Candidatus Aminicenantes bacterium]|nr:transcriptional repressor [Candidatus Aminicenantes bacterium]MDH5383874.1 transcriptional repressor [Candidatus Aminicenantes bacterium]MDH5742344.1 transcriptional repressor [Candidatus Aminicenantes bacterium]
MPGPRKWRHRYHRYFDRWTIPREAILDLLKRTSQHMSAKDVYTALYRMYPGIGLTTVYRTLDLLVRMGLINKFAFGDGQSRYEFKSEDKKGHHHHVICSECGKIIDYSDFLEDELELVRKTEKRLSEKYNFNVLGHNIEFYGLCEKCR